MITVMIFALTLVAAVLLSGLAKRSVLSSAVLFLAVGFLCGEEWLGLLSFSPDSPIESMFAQLALFSVLLTDGMRIGLRELVATWHLPGRALLLGMPLTLVGTALTVHWVVGFSWAESFLIGAALSPTDPVFAAAIVGRDELPERLRRLLNVESGLNDGLALPIVMIMLVILGARDTEMTVVFGEALLGITLGLVLPWVAIRLERSRFFSAADIYQPLNAFAIGLLVFAVCTQVHANAFLAAFTAGMTVATIGPAAQEAFHAFGEIVAELLKLAALLVFGALITLEVLHGGIGHHGYLFALIALFVVRPIALILALLGSQLTWPERLVAAWFGPKGFASVVLGLLIWQSGAPRASQLFHLLALTIAMSIVLHSSTDVIMARWLRKKQAPGRRPEGDAATAS